MEMSYARAWRLVDELNKLLSEPVVTTTTGGFAGGGATLVSRFSVLNARISSPSSGCVVAGDSGRSNRPKTGSLHRRLGGRRGRPERAAAPRAVTSARHNLAACCPKCLAARDHLLGMARLARDGLLQSEFASARPSDSKARYVAAALAVAATARLALKLTVSATPGTTSNNCVDPRSI